MYWMLKHPFLFYNLLLAIQPSMLSIGVEVSLAKGDYARASTD